MTEKTMNKTEFAQKLLEDGYDPKDIEKIVGCSSTTVENAKTKNKSNDNTVYAIVISIIATYLYMVYVI